MNQLIKILLNHPDKIERFFLWFLQSAILIWVMSYLFGFNILVFKSANGNLEVNFVQPINAMRLATYLLIFTICWALTWGVFAELSIKFLFYTLNWSIRQLRKFIWFLFSFLFFSIRLIFSFFTKVKKPTPFWKKIGSLNSEIEYENQFHKKISRLTEELTFFSEMNKFTKSSVGSELLLELTSMDKGEFIRSRIIRYYTITVIFSVIQFNAYDWTTNVWFKVFIIFILFLIGLFVFGFNDLYTRLNENTIFYLIPRIEFEVFLNHLKTNLEDSILIGDYDIQKNRRTISLSLKDGSMSHELKDKYFRKIEFVPFYEKALSTIKIVERIQNPESLVVYFSEDIPDIQIRNIIIKNKQCLIVAKNQEDFFKAINNLYPLITGEIKL